MFPATSLHVGSWARFAATQDNENYDLLCYAEDRQLTWLIQDSEYRFRVQIDFDAIQQLTLTPSDDMLHDELQVQLHNAGDVSFSMLHMSSQDWVRCGDFSENRQATTQAIHVLQAQQDTLRQALWQLFANAPDLFAKFVMLKQPLATQASPQQQPILEDLCRDLTLSPSVTPEPPVHELSSWMDNTWQQQNIGKMEPYQGAPQASWPYTMPAFIPDDNLLNFI